MASIYKRKDSKWYYIRFKAPDGRWISKPTRYRIDNTLHRAKALNEASALSVHERDRRGTSTQWVDRMLDDHQVSPNTKIYYRNSWRNLSRFMDERRILLQDFTPSTALDYIAWRTTTPRTNGSFPGRNQALQDIKILKWIHRQGRLLGHLTTMAMVDFRSRKAPVFRKPIFTDEEISRVRRALAVPHVPEWMRISFEIALHTGCRLKETRIPLDCVDLKTSTLTFPTPKGGAGRSYTIPIAAGLLPMLTRMKATPRSHTFEWPGCGTRVSSHWRKFFNLLGLRRHSFHGLRATRVTNLRRAGIVQSVAMRLVNHSSSLVHELYQRHSVEDLRPFVNAGLPPSTLQTPAETPVRAPWENPPVKTALEPDSTRSRTQPTAPANSSIDLKNASSRRLTDTAGLSLRGLGVEGGGLLNQLCDQLGK